VPLTIEIKKKHIFPVAIAVTLLFGIALANAFGTNNPAVLGHDSGELDISLAKLQSVVSSDFHNLGGTDANTQCDDQVCSTISAQDSLLLYRSGVAEIQIQVQDADELLIDTPADDHIASFEWTNGRGRFGVNCQGNMPSTSQLIISAGAGGTCQEAAGNSYMIAGDTSFTTTSSRKYKENITPVILPNILERIKTVPVVTFDFINGTKDHLGVIAEDFHTVLERGNPEQVKGDDAIWALWLAVQELTRENEQLKAAVCKDRPHEPFC